MTHDDNLARIQALRYRLPFRGDSAHTVAALDHVEDVLTRHAPQPRYLCRACHVENVLPRHAPQPRLTPAVHYVCRACGGVSPCVDYASAITLLDALDGGTDA